MSAGAWIRSQRDRPIGDAERRVAFTLVAVVAIATTLGLAITVPGAPSPTTATRPHAASRPETPAPGASVVSTAAAARVAREFLHGYLGYVYGTDRARDVRGATPAFAQSLLASPPRVPPSMRARHPRVIALHIVKAPGGVLGVTAVVNDGGLVDYPIALLLVRHGQGLLVSGLAGS
jgi:hypothetical protein